MSDEGVIDQFGCSQIELALTKFHEQGQEDPQRDLEGLPDVLVVEGEDGESLLVSRGVVLVVMGVPLRRSGWTSPRLVALRVNNITTRGGNRHENEQKNAQKDPQTWTGSPPGGTENSHFFFSVCLTDGFNCSTQQQMKMKIGIRREASVVGARDFYARALRAR